MKRDRFDDILQSKLQNPQSGYAVPSWSAMEHKLTLAENAAGIVPKRSLSRGFKYGIAAMIALLIGAGAYQFGRHSRDVVISLEHEATSNGAALAGLEERAISADKLVEPQSLNDPQLDKLFRSVRSVTPMSGKSAKSPLNSSNLATLSVPNSSLPGANPLAMTSFETLDLGSLEVPGIHPDKSASAAQSNYRTPAAYASAGRMGKAVHGNLFDNGFDWGDFEEKERHPWMMSAYTNAYAAGGSNMQLLSSNTAFNAALVESNYTKNAVSFMGRNLKHSFPVSVGINVKKQLNDRWSIESGLVYTFLQSTADLDAAYQYRYKQSIHYLGVPLGISYSLYRNKGLDIYLQGGGMAQFALSAHGQTRIFNQGEFASSINEDLPANGPLWSVNLGAGLSYDFVRNFGIYIEPGANYYFPNANHPQSYWTDNPWSFNVRVGFRFKF